MNVCEAPAHCAVGREVNYREYLYFIELSSQLVYGPNASITSAESVNVRAPPAIYNVVGITY